MSDYLSLKCPNCGATLVKTTIADTYLCNHCGNQVLIKPNNNASNPFFSCPNCHDPIYVKKASSIVNEILHLNGTTPQQSSYQDKDGHWQTQYYNQPVTGTIASTTAQKLTPPIKPTIGSGCSFLPIILGFFAFGIIFLLCGGGPLMLLSLPSSVDSLTSTGSAIGNTIIWILGLGIIAFGVLLFVFIIRGIKKSLKNSSNKHKLNKKQYEEILLPKWNKNMERWNKLFYCSRCDIIFIPGENTFSPIANFSDFLSKETS